MKSEESVFTKAPPSGSDKAAKTRFPNSIKDLWDLRRAVRDERQDGGISRDPGGTSGGRSVFPIVAGLFFLAALAQTLSIHIRAGLQDEMIPLWRPALEECSSVAAIVACTPFLELLVRRLRPYGWGAVSLSLYAVAAVVFSLTHTSLMVAIRSLLWPLLSGGDLYRFGTNLETWILAYAYEFSVDITTFVVLVLVFNLIEYRRLLGGVVGAPEPVLTPDLTREAGGLVAVAAASNYVEQYYRGQKPKLVRDTLSATYERLADLGFVRCHKSWIVHPSAVTTMKSTGSGDYVLELDSGLSVPVSRRYREALLVVRQSLAARQSES